jgi:hypothetical protein
MKKGTDQRVESPYKSKLSPQRDEPVVGRQQSNYLPVVPDQALTALASRQAVPPSGSRIRVIYRAPSVELSSLPQARDRTTFGMIKPPSQAPFAQHPNSPIPFSGFKLQLFPIP